METVREQTRSSLNEQIQRIRELQKRYPDQEIIFNFTLFNHEVHHARLFSPAEKLRELKPGDYTPNGMTALYDAIGDSIYMLRSRIETEIARNEASAVVVILTDGYENSSRRFNHAQVGSLIKELDQSPLWTFSFIGATWDAMQVAESINIPGMNALATDQAGLAQESRRMAKRMESYIDLKFQTKTPKDFMAKDTLSFEDEE
jgi:hypothetical protein